MIFRAKPLLGTLVTVQVEGHLDDVSSHRAIEGALAMVSHIDRVMSAHSPDSDLGRMSRAKVGQSLTLDSHTITVLQASQYWRQRSGGAFDPFKAATQLAQIGSRPAFTRPSGDQDTSEILEFLSQTQVLMPGPLNIDLGGIAKGYAVDQAIVVLGQHGVQNAIVNAGGDLRVLGNRGFPVEIRHAQHQLRDRLFKRLRRFGNAALASSVADAQQTEFVWTAKGHQRTWRNATVIAPDCMTADALTKWALQSSPLCPALRAALLQHHARMWRS